MDGTVSYKSGDPFEVICCWQFATVFNQKVAMSAMLQRASGTDGGRLLFWDFYFVGEDLLFDIIT